MGAFRTVILTIVVASVGTAPTFASLWPKWVDSFTYSHGSLIVPLCAWLIWRERHRVNAESVKPALWAIAPLAVMLFLWTLSFAASIEIGVEALLPVILLCAVLVTCGGAIARIVAFPILLLYSAIPIWDLINSLLQNITTQAVDAILAVIGVPAYIQGNSVQIPSGFFEIAGGCSGLHFFIVALTLAAVYGHLYYTNTRNKFVLFGIAAGMALTMNWLRVATIITAGHMTDMQSYLVQVDHYFFGWVLFAVILIPFFLIARRMEPDSNDGEAPDELPVATVLPLSIANVAVTAIILMLPVLVWGRLIQNEPQPVAISLPSIAGISGPEAYSGSWTPIFRGSDGEAAGTYISSGQQIDVYANWYMSQSQGRELIAYGNSVTGPGLRAEASRVYVESSAGNDAKLRKIREIIVSSDAFDRRLIWFHYVIGRRGETSILKAKLRQGWQSMAGGDGSGLVSVSVVCETGDQHCQNARLLLEQEFARIDKAVRETLFALARS